jgi:hypothetical protein
LRFRLLPHVPRHLTFSCTYCRTVLTYSDANVPLGALLWGTKLRSLCTFLGGMLLFSGISLAAGHVVALAAIAILSVVLSATHLLSPSP